MHYITNKPVAQGDMLIRKIDALPHEVVEVKPENGNYILTHSETGHHHIVKAEPDVHFYQHANDNNLAYLVVDNTTKVEHLRNHDTHAPFGFNPGIYEIRRQIESGPEGFRRAID